MSSENVGLEHFFEKDPYSLAHDEKEALLGARLVELQKLHYKNCAAYREIFKTMISSGMTGRRTEKRSVDFRWGGIFHLKIILFTYIIIGV